MLDRIREAGFAPQRDLSDLAARQLGTVGAGNHYVDLFAGDDGHVWIGVHFGSRDFGHKTASGFLALAAGRRFDERGPEGEMDSPPVLLHVGSQLGQAYISAMRLAGEYAYAGRDVVVDRVLEILGARSTYAVHNHHNFAWRERHFGADLWVIRKGCTPAFPGQEASSARRWRAERDPARHRRPGRRRPAPQHRPRRRPPDVAHAGRREDGHPGRVRRASLRLLDDVGPLPRRARPPGRPGGRAVHPLPASTGGDDAPAARASGAV